MCSTCSHRSERAVIIDPKIKWWVAHDGEYWHESAGVFISNKDGKFLFFERTKFPAVVTIPAGHVDVGEEPHDSALREVSEEVGLDIKQVRHIVSDDIVGDSCRRGCDAHRWHAFMVDLEDTPEVSVGSSEGEKPTWLSLDEAMTKEHFSFPTKYIVTRHKDRLQQTD